MAMTLENNRKFEEKKTESVFFCVKSGQASEASTSPLQGMRGQRLQKVLLKICSYFAQCFFIVINAEIVRKLKKLFF